MRDNCVGVLLRMAPVVHSFFLLFLVATAAIPGSVNAAASSQQTDALLAWKSSLAGPAALSGWTRATPVCTWRGVGCDAAAGGRVTTLRLRGLGLGGGLHTLELDFAAFPALTELDLNGNSFAGDIPAGISQLRSLASLDLGDNGFNGSIPPQIGHLSGLVDLCLYNNNLVGAIPHQLSRLPKIAHFDLGANYLTDQDFAKFSPMPTVTFMSLYDNSINGSFPDFILKSGNITYLDLSQNTLFGLMPDTLPEKLPNLMYLNLSNNEFSGRIPASSGG